MRRSAHHLRSKHHCRRQHHIPPMRKTSCQKEKPTQTQVLIRMSEKQPIERHQSADSEMSLRAGCFLSQILVLVVNHKYHRRSRALRIKIAICNGFLHKCHRNSVTGIPTELGNAPDQMLRDINFQLREYLAEPRFKQVSHSIHMLNSDYIKHIIFIRRYYREIHKRLFIHAARNTSFRQVRYAFQKHCVKPRCSYLGEAL